MFLALPGNKLINADHIIAIELVEFPNSLKNYTTIRLLDDVNVTTPSSAITFDKIKEAINENVGVFE